MKSSSSRGFSLIELMIALAIVGILTAVALPSYRGYIVRSARVQAQTELLELASMQEKIYLNSNAYSASVTGAYAGTAAGGLGRTSGQTRDGKYTVTVALNAAGAAMGTTPQSFVLTATPVSGGSQASDGNLTLSETGRKTWGSVVGW